MLGRQSLSMRAEIRSARDVFDDFMKEANILVEPVTAEQAKIARAAYRDFGKGSVSRRT
jgi:ribonuclease VapC